MSGQIVTLEEVHGRVARIETQVSETVKEVNDMRVSHVETKVMLLNVSRDTAWIKSMIEKLVLMIFVVVIGFIVRFAMTGGGFAP